MIWREDIIKTPMKKRKELAALLGEQCSELFGNNQATKDLDFITKGADLVGFVPQITNVKHSRPKNVHDHILNSPALVFASRTCPCSIIMSPNLSKEIKQSMITSRDEFNALCKEVYFSKASQGVCLALNWFLDLTETSKKHFEIAEQNALDAAIHFKKGKKSKIGTKFGDSLAKDFILIGFSPNIIYVKVESENEDELAVEWCHPFSQPTLLFQHKTLPIILQVNGNIDFNETRLAKIPDNLKDKKMANVITNLAGFTG